MPVAQDLTGRVFGKLTAVEYSYSKGAKRHWLCRCECGKEKTIDGNALKIGATNSCGCLKKGPRQYRVKNITGLKFNKLTALPDHKNIPGLRGTYWLFRCECGTEKFIYAGNVQRGTTKSCGCFRTQRTHERSKEARGRQQETTEGTMLRCARYRATRDGLPFSIEESDIIIPDVCPIFGIPLKKGEGKLCNSSPSLDKIVPSLGYVKGNISVLSLKANRLKSDLNVDQLKTIVAYIESRGTIAPFLPKPKEESVEITA